MSAIGGFQFNNLVQGRIPFLFVNLGVDTSLVYPHVYKMHLDRTLLTLDGKDIATATAEEIIVGIQALKYPAMTAIVVLDENGDRAPAIAEAIENAGFTNVFFVRGGWHQLLIEKESGF